MANPTERPAFVRLPPLPLNGAFGILFDASDTPGYTGAALKLVIDNKDTGVRKELTEADATVSVDGLTVTFSKNTAWTAANLTDGHHVALLYRDGVFDGGATFVAYTPDCGEVNP